MDQLLLHPRTKSHVDQVLLNRPQGLIMSGKAGSGKYTLSRYVAAKLLDISAERLDSHPFVHTVRPKDTAISIEDIRSLQQFLKLKVPADKHRATNRIVIIEQADSMRTEAQNALLKTLEEPPTGTVLILTASNPDALLPTITSRTQQFEILPVSFDDAAAFFSQRKTKMTLEQAYALSGGQAGLLYALLSDESHPLITYVNLAKEILAENQGTRLLRTEELAKSKADIPLLLDAFLRISHAALAASSKKQNDTAVRHWHRCQKAVIASIHAFSRNASPKLLLDNLFLSI